jgi:vitamin B12 transporter
MRVQTVATTLAAALPFVNPLAPAGADDAVELAPIVVTATRTARTADETLAPVTVIDRAAIERMQARSVPDALRGVPGLAVASNGGRGQQTSVFLRGTNSSHVLVLIDGVKVGSPTTGGAPFQDYPIDQVERIEVVRGPRSSLYGSEAIGGVIQIFTRRGGGPLAPRLTVGGGSEGTVNGAFGLSGGGDRGWVDASAGFEATDGFDACRGEPFVGGCFVREPDRDRYRNDAGHLRAGYRFDGGAEVDLHWLRSETDTHFDGIPSSGNELGTVQQVAGAALSLFPTPSWKLALSAGRSRDEGEYRYDGVFLNRIDTERDTVSVQSDVFVAEQHGLTLGLDHQQDRVDATEDYTEDSRRNTGAFGQYQGTFGAHDLRASLRHDDNEQFGGHTTGDGAWGYTLANGLRLTASYGTAFKTPTFNDLYYPFVDYGFGFGYSGNPDLEPERSRSVEVGVGGPWRSGSWSLNLYQTDLDDLIAIDTSAPISMPVNVAEARIRGLEAVANARIAAWDLGASLTLLDPENRSDGPSHGNRLPRRPEQTLSLDLDRDLGRYRLGASLLLVGRRFDDLANDVRLDAYTLVDLRAEYRFSDSLTLQGRIENLLDEEYETAAYYNQPGRSFYLTLRYQP